jgi:MoaA/NifB/PqqE/SkfB family radical SAM enzyme
MSVLFKVVKEAALLKLRPKVSHLILHVTNICNFRCHHCFVEFAQKPKDLTMDEISQVADFFDDLIWLDIGGGEPFIRQDLAEIVTKFTAKEISIPTNGWFTEKIVTTLEKIEKRFDLSRLILTISVDGLRKTHDEIRNQKGSFDRLVASYHIVRQKFPNLRVKLNTVINHRNVQEIVPLMEWAKAELNPAFHSILFLRGSPLNPDYRLPSAVEMRALEDKVYEVQQRYLYGRSGLLSDVQRHYQWIKREISNQIISQKKQVIPCLGGQAHFVVYANGEVAPCELLPSVGSLRKNSLAEILDSTPATAAVKSIREKQCHCTHDCNMVENVLFNFSLYPKLMFGSKTRIVPT